MYSVGKAIAVRRNRPMYCCRDSSPTRACVAKHYFEASTARIRVGNPAPGPPAKNMSNFGCFEEPNFYVGGQNPNQTPAPAGRSWRLVYVGRWKSKLGSSKGLIKLKYLPPGVRSGGPNADPNDFTQTPGAFVPAKPSIKPMLRNKCRQCATEARAKHPFWPWAKRVLVCACVC